MRVGTFIHGGAQNAHEGLLDKLDRQFISGLEDAGGDDDCGKR